MNVRLLIIGLASPAWILASEPLGETKPSVMAESSMLLKDTYHYQPIVAPEAERNQEPVDDVVKLRPFVVSDWMLQRDLSRKLKDDSQRLKEEQFSITKGGTFFKNERYELGGWADSADLKLFADDAKYTDKKPMYRIGVLHIKF